MFFTGMPHAQPDQLSCISTNQMVGHLITLRLCLEARAAYLFFMAPIGGAFLLETLKILKFMSEFSSSRQFIFDIILKYQSFLALKTSEIRKQRRIQNAFRSTNKSFFFRGRSRTPLTSRGRPPLSCSPLRHSILFSPDHFLERGDGPGIICLLSFYVRNHQHF